MYQLSQQEREAVLNLGAHGECDDALRDAAERRVQASLPVIPGLDAATTAADRQAILSATLESQRRAFVAHNGSPFGDDLNAEPQKLVVSERWSPVAA